MVCVCVCPYLLSEDGLFIAQQNAEAVDTLSLYKRIVFVFISISHQRFDSSDLANLAFTFSFVVVCLVKFASSSFSAVLTTMFYPFYFTSPETSEISTSEERVLLSQVDVLTETVQCGHILERPIFMSVFIVLENEDSGSLFREGDFFLKELKLLSEWISSSCHSFCTLTDAEKENSSLLLKSCTTLAALVHVTAHRSERDFQGVVGTPSFQQKCVAIPYLSLPVFSCGQVG